MNSGQNSLSRFLPPLAALVVVFLFAVAPSQAQTVQVDLSSTSSLCGGNQCFNAPGLYNDGIVYFGESFMDGGTECTPPAGFTLCPAAYGAQQLFGSTYNASATTPPTLNIANVPFTFGLVNSSANLPDGATACGASGTPPCIDNVVNLTTAGVTVTLPAAEQTVYSTIIFLGTAVNGHHAATFTVTYTTGSPDVFNQTVSDWCGFGGNPNETIAISGVNRLVANGSTISPACNLYAYTYSVDYTRILQSITMKDADGSGASFVFAITLKPPSYTIDAGLASPTSINTGSSSQASISIQPQNGYIGTTIQLSCSITPVIVGDPPSAATAPTCSLNPTSVPIANPTSQLTFNAASPSSAHLQRAGGIFYALWLPLPGLALLGFGFRNPKKTKLFSLLILGFVLVAMASTPACVSTVNLGNVGTPPGQYTVTVTGVDNNNLTQATNPSTSTNQVVFIVSQ